MSAPDWRTRADLREMKGRPRFYSAVRRIDTSKKTWRGDFLATYDPRGFDVLEEQAQYRRRSCSKAEPFPEFSKARYAELRAISRQKCSGLRHAEFMASCQQLTEDCRRIRASIAP